MDPKSPCRKTKDCTSAATAAPVRRRPPSKGAHAATPAAAKGTPRTGGPYSRVIEAAGGFSAATVAEAAAATAAAPKGTQVWLVVERGTHPRKGTAQTTPEANNHLLLTYQRKSSGCSETMRQAVEALPVLVFSNVPHQSVRWP